MISYWSGDDGDWFLDKARRNFPNKGRDLYDMTKAMHVWEPSKKEDGLRRNKRRNGNLKRKERKNSSCVLWGPLIIGLGLGFLRTWGKSFVMQIPMYFSIR